MLTNQHPNPFKFYTDDKTPELALFYNIACDRMERLLLTELSKPIQAGKARKPEEIERDIRRIAQSNGVLDLPDYVWIRLKHYLWKDDANDKNSSGSSILLAEKHLITAMLAKLYALRDFQSHYFHENSCLFFDDNLASFMEKRYDYALGKLAEQYATEVANYLKRFEDYAKQALKDDQHSSPNAKSPLLFNPEYLFIFRQVGANGAQKLTYEGKAFFLSFFLTTGEMVRFLKQRRGAKRDDLRDFKLKHECYTFYCHREGANRFRFEQEPSWVDLLDTESQTKIMGLKKQLNLINYLNDIPDVLFDTTLFSLPKATNTMSEEELLLGFIKDRQLFDGLEWCLEPSKAPEKPTHKRVSNAYKKPLPEAKQLSNYLYCNLKAWPDYTFKIPVKVAHQMCLFALWKNDGGAETIRRLFDLVLERYQFRRLLVLLQNPKVVSKIIASQKHSERLFQYLNDFSLYKIRNGSPAFKEKFDRWLHLPQSRQQKRNELTKSDLLANIQHYARWLPIEVRFTYMFLEKSSKPRNRDVFMKTAIEFLMERKPNQKIEWHWESYHHATEELNPTIKNNTTTLFAAAKPDGKWRLRFTPDNQILCKLKGSPRPFLIGHKAMRNLVIAVLERDTNPENFLMALQADLERVIKGAALHELKLLTKNSLPATLVGRADHQLVSKVQVRINWLMDTLKQQLQDAKTTKRADKNRQIMQCYRLFNWPKRKSNGVEMFLRNNEYNQLSIYHYMLQKKRIEPILNEIQKYERRFPREIWDLLHKSRSLDELHANVCKLTLTLLANWQAALPNHAEAIARKLGVPVYSCAAALPTYIPFAIHPLTVVKYYYGDALEQNPKWSLAARFRDDEQIGQGLVYSNYAIDSLLDALKAQGVPQTQLTKAVGKLTEQLTYDKVLLAILQKMNPAITQLANLYNQALVLGTDVSKLNANLIIRMRELNSFSFTFSPEQMNLLIAYYLRQHPGPSTQDLPSIEFSELVKLRQRIEHASLAYIHAILGFEASVVAGFANEIPAVRYLDFKAICQKAALDSEVIEQLKAIRSTALHANTPNGWTYHDDAIQNQAVLKNLLEKYAQQRASKQQYYAAGGVSPFRP